MTRLPLVALAGLIGLLALNGCDKPKPRKPAPPPEIAAVAGGPPRPAYPEWAVELVGKPFAATYPAEPVACVGNTDRVAQKYGGATPGVRIEGWSWRTAEKKPMDRILLVDRNAVIVGAGQTDHARPDVNAARPDITGDTGWTAVTSLVHGPVDAYGIDGQGAPCRLGHLEF